MTPQLWARMKEIFGEALEKPESERRTFLDSACDGDAELRAEVERLLAENADSLHSPALGLLNAARELAPGDEVGHYRIESKLGEGGMGVVYKARDTRLDRFVAIKLLRAGDLGSEDRMARFIREAKVLASLNHPNIATIYGIEDGAIVMELVEGDDLKGPLPLDTALHYAGQIADALEAAHEKSITHRDLKPANIKVTAQGVVKVLDFGLAKLHEPAGVSGTGVGSPALTMRETEAGMILGTATYMAPEQARSQSVDKRADIWAFGVVLWEAITGRRMFKGETISDILAGVLTNAPDLEAVPPQVRRLLAACLEKDPRHRLRDIGDWRRLLEQVAPQAPARRWTWIVAACLALAALVSVWAPWRNGSRGTGRPLLQLDLDMGSDFGGFAISADGLTLAFVQNGQLGVRRLDRTKSTMLAGTEGASFPFFSPNGHWIGFFSHRKLRKITVDGDSLQALCDAPNGRGGAWTSDDWIVLSPDTYSALWRVPAAGGKSEPFTTLHGETVSILSHRWTTALPGGKGILFSAHPTGGLPDAVRVARPNGQETKTLVEVGARARYTAGHLLYYRQGTIFAAPFDLNRLEVTGAAVPLADGVADARVEGPAFDASPNGTVVYRRGTGGINRKIAWLDAKGQFEVLTEAAGGYIQPRLSPDGKRLAFTLEREGERSVWVYDLAQKAMKQLISGAVDQDNPIWTHDGVYLVFRSGETLGWMRADGSGALGKLRSQVQGLVPEDVSPDGRWLVFHRTGPPELEVWRAKVEFTGGGLTLTDAKPLPLHNFDESARISPDGQWIAYESLESGRRDVYVTRFSPSGSSESRWLVSAQEGLYPVWSRSGQQLFLRMFSGHFLVAPWSAKGGNFAVEAPHRWTGAMVTGLGPISIYDVAPDGARLLVMMETASPAPETLLRVLLNVNEEQERRAAKVSGAK